MTNEFSKYHAKVRAKVKIVSRRELEKISHPDCPICCLHWTRAIAYDRNLIVDEETGHILGID